MQAISTAIPDVKIIEPKVFGDERGFFLETFRTDWFKKECADVDFVQDNHSKSSQGILRGLHYQMEQTQGKLVLKTNETPDPPKDPKAKKKKLKIREIHAFFWF